MSYYYINLQQRKKNIIYVPQKAVVFSGRIKDNLLLGNKDISEQTIFEVCKICFDIKTESECLQLLENEIIEDGNNLSGGQLQRISLARAILRKPDVLILDEAMSNIDMVAEQLLLNNMKKLLRHTTFIV